MTWRRFACPMLIASATSGLMGVNHVFPVRTFEAVTVTTEPIYSEDPRLVWTHNSLTYKAEPQWPWNVSIPLEIGRTITLDRLQTSTWLPWWPGPIWSIHDTSGRRIFQAPDELRASYLIIVITVFLLFFIGISSLSLRQRSNE